MYPCPAVGRLVSLWLEWNSRDGRHHCIYQASISHPPHPPPRDGFRPEERAPLTPSVNTKVSSWLHDGALPPSRHKMVLASCCSPRTDASPLPTHLQNLPHPHASPPPAPHGLVSPSLLSPWLCWPKGITAMVWRPPIAAAAPPRDKRSLPATLVSCAGATVQPKTVVRIESNRIEANQAN